MHILQQKILKLAGQMNLGTIGLRKLGQLIGETHPQKVKHHLGQLEKRGFLSINAKKGEIRATKTLKSKTPGLFSLPILGTANCGPADIFAEENLEGYLKVSPMAIGRKKAEGLFVIKAVGDSMNSARAVPNGPICNGDYVIIDSNKQTPRNGEYVLSIIDDTANIKRFYFDRSSKQIALVSESSLPIEPIYIHASDLANYLVNGEVIGVIKQPKFI
jgi:repressor LexA